MVFVFFLGHLVYGVSGIGRRTKLFHWTFWMGLLVFSGECRNTCREKNNAENKSLLFNHVVA